MATGDLVNNIRKMQTMLKSIKYVEKIDVNALADGIATEYLPIYHYAFTSFSPSMSELILHNDVQLYAKSDARFMEVVYKILRDLFAYKPPITKEQFFAKGYAERKVIMCADVLDLVKKKAKELNPGHPKMIPKTSARSRSATEMPDFPHLYGVPKAKSVDQNRSSMKDSNQKPANHCKISPRAVPHVVNELLTVPEASCVRHVASSPTQALVRHVACHKGSASIQSPSPVDNTEAMPSNFYRFTSHPHELGANKRPDKHAAIVSPRNDKLDERPDTMKTNWLYTPSISRVCTKSVEVINMPREEAVSPLDMTIVDVQAVVSDSILQGPVPDSPEDDHNTEISTLHKSVEILTNMVLKLDNTVQEVQRGGAEGISQDVQHCLQKLQSDIDNLAARMVLIENRVSIIECLTTDDMNNMHSFSNTVSNTVSNSAINVPVESDYCVQKALTGMANYGLKPAEEQKLMPQAPPIKQSLMKEAGDCSLNYSPIRNVANGLSQQLVSANEDTFATESESNDRRSSTPTLDGTWLSDTNTISNLSYSTNVAASRIKNMLKDTKMHLTKKVMPANESVQMKALN